MADASSAASGAVKGATAGAAFGPWGAVIGGVIGLGASLLGGTDHSAEDKMKAIQQLYANLQDPNFDMSSLNPQQKKVAAQLTPEMMQAAEMVSPTTTSDSGAGKDAQLSALGSLQKMGQGGLNLQDQADLQNVKNQEATANKGQQDAILANMNARGTGGSGQELAAQMIAQQGAADNAANQGTQVAANSQMRALQALQAGGQMGAQMRSADASQSGRNADIINQFNQANFANKQGIANQNVANRNAAQGFNVSNQQNIANQNVDTNNQFAQYNQSNQNNLRQQQFGNDLNKINGQAGVGSQVANYMNANAAGAQSRQQGIAQGLGSLVNAGVSAYGSGGSSSSGGFAGADQSKFGNIA